MCGAAGSGAVAPTEVAIFRQTCQTKSSCGRAKGRWQREAAEDFNQVGIRFFDTMTIPDSGWARFGSPRTERSPKVAVINQALAPQARFPNMKPIGKRFRNSTDGTGIWSRWGVCAEYRYDNRRSDPRHNFYAMCRCRMIYHRKYAPDEQRPRQWRPRCRRCVQSLDPDLPIYRLRRRREQIEAGHAVRAVVCALTRALGCWLWRWSAWASRVMACRWRSATTRLDSGCVGAQRGGLAA